MRPADVDHVTAGAGDDAVLRELVAQDLDGAVAVRFPECDRIAGALAVSHRATASLDVAPGSPRTQGTGCGAPWPLRRADVRLVRSTCRGHSTPRWPSLFYCHVLRKWHGIPDAARSDFRTATVSERSEDE